MKAPKSPIILRKGIEHKSDTYEQVTLCVFTLFNMIFENVKEYWGYKVALTIKPYLIKLMFLIS